MNEKLDLSGEHDANHPSHTISFAELDSKTDLDVGTVIQGIPTLDGFEVIDTLLAERLVKKAQPAENKRIIYQSHLPEPLQEELKRQHFFGKTSNHQAVIIPTDLTLLTEAERERVSANRASSIITISDLFSTGRGNIGSFSTLATVYINYYSFDGHYLLYPNRSFHEYHINTKYRNLNTYAFQELLLNSNQQWSSQARTAISRVYPGGLPSLGKKI